MGTQRVVLVLLAVACGALATELSTAALERIHISAGKRFKEALEQLKQLKIESEGASPPLHETVLLRSRRAVTGPCEPGFTGENCDNPICERRSTILPHDGSVDRGETIDSELSEACDQTFAFGVDEYLSTVYVIIYGLLDSNPFGDLYDPNGVLVSPSITESRSQSVAYTYKDVAAERGLGTYTFTVNSFQRTACMYTVAGPSALVIDGGFVYSQRDDNVQAYAPVDHKGITRNPKLGNETYFAFTLPSELRYPGRPTMVGIYATGVYETDMPVRARYKCNAGAIAGPFVCTRAESYHAKIVGVDSQGNTWQRVYSFTCEVSGTPSPSSSAAPPTQCFNGGILYANNVTNASECYCGQYFEGNQCETKRCFNDGQLQIDDRCRCEPGFTNTYCQDVLCASRSGINFDISRKALTFVVRATQSMAMHRIQIVEAASRITGFYSKSERLGYFQRFVLVAIANRQLRSIESFNNFTHFVEAIQRLPLEEDTTCEDSLLLGLTAALNTPDLAQFTYSPIFLFSDGLYDDDDAEVQTLLHQLTFWRGQVFFMLTDSNSVRKCTVDIASSSYINLRYLAFFSHGLVAHVPVSSLAETAFNIASTVFNVAYLLSNDLIHSCAKAPEYQTFFVDSRVRYFFVTATGTNLSCSITLPDRTIISPQLYYQSANVYIWQVSSAMQYGAHQLSIKGNARYPCQYRVQGFTNQFLFLGVTDNINRDATIGQPVMGEETHIVASLSSVAVEASQSLHTEVVVWTNEGDTDTRVALYMSSGYYRDGCDFFLYYGSWVCNTPNLFYYVNIFFVDENGRTIMRTSTGFCSSSTVTQTPPDGCMNGGVPSADKTCYCPPHYNGTRCERLVCLNHGIPVGSSCDCIAGFSGQFCEQVTCTKKNEDVSWSPNGRSLTFLIHDSISTRSSIRTLRDNVVRMLDNSLAQHAEWIRYFEVIRFNNTNSEVLASSSDMHDFLNGLTALYDRNIRNSEISCRDLPVLSVLHEALNNPNVSYQGIMFMFVNGYLTMDYAVITPLYELLENTKVMLNIVLLSGSPCGTSLDGYQSRTLMNLAEFSGGEFIMGMPSNAGKIAHFLPTLYFSSYVYENLVENCSVTPQTFYFPVDSQMQSFTAYVVGDLLTDPVYYSPLQEEDDQTQGQWKQETLRSIWNDIGMGSRMDQKIQGCDLFWHEVEDRCVLYGYDPLPWADAQAVCHSNGAVMATIYDAYEQAFLDREVDEANYWIGLNDLATADKWVWDQLKGELSLDATGYKNWGANQPPTGDLRNRCVFDSHGASKGWIAADCSLPKLYICMKHAYDSDFEPTMDGKMNILPRGIWKMNVQTYEGSCYVQIFSQSGIRMFTEYTSGVHDDVGEQQPLQSASSNRIIAHMTNQNWAGQGVEGKLQYAHLYGTENITNIIQAQHFSKRDDSECSYEYVSNEFRCPSATFVVMATGIDRYGYMYQRLEQIMCLKGPTNDSDCGANGVYRKGECYCAPGYEGLFCDQPMCTRGELTAGNTRCKCPYGFSGLFCEKPECTKRGTVETPTPGNRTFVLVLDGVQAGAMTDIIANLNPVLTGVFTETQRYTDWFTHYTGIVVRDLSANDTVAGIYPYSVTIESDTPTEFVNLMTTEASKQYTTGTTSRAVMHALSSVLSSKQVLPRSDVFVVTAGDAEDYLYETTAMDAIGRRRGTVYFLIVGDQTTPGGKPDNDTSVEAYYDVAEMSGGGYYQVQGTATGLRTFWSSLVSNLYDPFYLSRVVRRNCSSLVEYVQVGANTTDFLIDGYMRVTPNVTITDADGNDVTGVVKASTATNYIMSVDTTGVPGLWKIQIDRDAADGGFCAITVRGQSTSDVYVAFIHDVGIDGGLHTTTTASYPLVGVSANAISAMTRSGTLLYVQAFSVDERTLLWSSTLIERNKCDWPYVSSELFTCPAASFALALDGVDALGHPFRRMFHIHCIGNFAPETTPLTTLSPPSTVSPPSTTPLPTCDPDVPKFDVVLVFDASADMTYQEYLNIIDVMADIPNHVTISPNHTRFILGTYADTVDFSRGNYFANISDAEEFRQAISYYRLHGFKGTVGNNIMDIFLNINHDEYNRIDAERLLIFFSSNGWDGYEDPTERARSFRNGGIGVMPIGYGPLVNMAQLNALSLCAKQARNQQELAALLPWIKSVFCMQHQTC